MSEDTGTTTPAPEGGETTEATPPVEDQRVPYERFQKANQKAKEAAERATKIEQQLQDLQAQIQEREEAGLPELERERKRAEALEKRIADAEARAEQAEQKVQRTHRENLIAAAAAAQNFANPARAARLIDDLDSIEDADQAERAVKRLAKSDPYLVKAEAAPLPGRVLENGKQTAKTADAGEEDPKAGLGAELLHNVFGIPR
jgi:hypothetical protein